MIAYNNEGLKALQIRDAAGEWHKKGLLSDEQWQAVQSRNPVNFYSPNVFVRIGLAIFSLILLLAAMGLVAIFAEPRSEDGLALFGLFWGVVWILVLDFWAIRSIRHYGSGVDDILLYTGVIAIVISLCSLFPYNTGALAYCCVAWPFLIAGTMRYVDRLMAAAAYFCTFLIVLLSVKEMTSLAIYLLPFTGMFFSAAAYLFSRNGQKRPSWRLWHGVFAVLELLALLTFYTSGNFWVIQQAGAEFFGLEQVPLAGFFWAFTFTVPALYIFMGLRRKNHFLLDIGIGFVAASILTFRYYFHVFPLAWTATICGAVLFAIAYFSIRYLRKHEGAYTYEAGSEKSLLLEVEEQLIEQTITSQTAPVPVKKDGFGGGQFGGGGAEGEF